VKGFIHLYTGNGKGKTTAAIGLAIRAVGAGKKVFIAQFVKGMHYAELDALKRFPEIEIHQYGLKCFIEDKPTKEDIDAARKGLNEVSEVLSSKNFDIIILDEMCIALYYKLFSLEDVTGILMTRNLSTELVLTGRYAPKELIDIADLVTEMKEIKHYYTKGIKARKGIEY
jgi:cob(I)alamin adenosyltransferase